MLEDQLELDLDNLYEGVVGNSENPIEIGRASCRERV